MTTKTRRERITYRAQKATVKHEPMTVAQVAEYTGWSKRTVYNKVLKREISYYKPLGSRRVLFEKADIDAILFANRIASNDEMQIKAAALGREV